MQLDKIKSFVEPYYKSKDLMHDLSHIERVINKAIDISNNYQCNKNVIIAGALFHGLLSQDKKDIIDFLNYNIENKTLRNEILLCAEGSDKNSIPVTLEAKILHDAHILEGGLYFPIIKSLITGSLRGQTLEETLCYYEENIIDKFSCYLPENKLLLEKYNKQCKEVLISLKSSI